MTVLAVRRFGPEPTPRAQEGAAAIRLYSTSRRHVAATPKSDPHTAQTAEGLTAKETRDDQQYR